MDLRIQTKLSKYHFKHMQTCYWSLFSQSPLVQIFCFEHNSMKSWALTDTFHSLKVEVWRYHNKIDICYTKNIANFGRSFGVWSQDRLAEWGRKKCNVLIEQNHDNVCTYSWISSFKDIHVKWNQKLFQQIQFTTYLLYLHS